MKITVCIGSSCHLKGSRQVVENLQELIDKNNLGDKVSLAGTFCTGNCQKGVCAMIGDEVYSLSADNTTEFFEKEVLPNV